LQASAYAEIMVKPSVRPATISDIETILHHRRSMYLDMGVATPQSAALLEPASRTFFEAALPTGGYYGLLVEVEGAVVAGGGVLLADWPGSPSNREAKRAWILNVYVEKAWRKRGLARLVMESLVDWCRAQGFKSVSLHSSDEGRGLYEKMGFRPTNEMRLTL